MKMQRVKELLQNYNRINMSLEYNERMGFDPENVRVLGYSDSTIKRRMRKAIEQTFELSEQSSAF